MPFPKVPYGASYWLNPEKALIQLSLRGKSADTLWFTIFHELGHILKHNKKELFIEIDHKSSKSVDEQEADEFAAETLIPSERLDDWLKKNPRLDASKISRFSKELDIAPDILVGRLQHIRQIKYRDFNQLKCRYDWSQGELALCHLKD